MNTIIRVIQAEREIDILQRWKEGCIFIFGGVLFSCLYLELLAELIRVNNFFIIIYSHINSLVLNIRVNDIGKCTVDMIWGGREDTFVYVFQASYQKNLSDPPHNPTYIPDTFKAGTRVTKYITKTSNKITTLLYLLHSCLNCLMSHVSITATCPRGHKYCLDSDSFSSRCQQSDSFRSSPSWDLVCCSACLGFLGIPRVRTWDCHSIQNYSIAVDFGNWTNWASPLTSSCSISVSQPHSHRCHPPPPGCEECLMWRSHSWSGARASPWQRPWCRSPGSRDVQHLPPAQVASHLAQGHLQGPAERAAETSLFKHFNSEPLATRGAASICRSKNNKNVTPGQGLECARVLIYLCLLCGRFNSAWV